MDKFVRLTATACPLSLSNLNTDQILPARYLKWPRSKGLGTVLFDDVRLDAKGQLREDFAFNEDAYRGAKILLAGRNFGGGSSREAAVYALYDHGFRCVVAPSFGDIFAQNAVKNGLLTAVAAESDIEKLAVLVREKPIAAGHRRPRTADGERQRHFLCVHDRPDQPQSIAQRLGRRRPDGELPRADRGLQGERQDDQALGRSVGKTVTTRFPDWDSLDAAERGQISASAGEFARASRYTIEGLRRVRRRHHHTSARPTRRNALCVEGHVRVQNAQAPWGTGAATSYGAVTAGRGPQPARWRRRTPDRHHGDDRACL